MKLQRLVISTLALAPTLALAHPGHEASPLHLHLGTPAASNSLDLQLTCAALVLGLVVLASRFAKRR